MILLDIYINYGHQSFLWTSMNFPFFITEINSLVRTFYLQMQKVQGLAKDGNPYTVMNGRLLTKSYACMIDTPTVLRLKKIV
jgi:hypothetical protein